MLVGATTVARLRRAPEGSERPERSEASRPPEHDAASSTEPRTVHCVGRSSGHVLVTVSRLVAMRALCTQRSTQQGTFSALLPATKWPRPRCVIRCQFDRLWAASFCARCALLQRARQSPSTQHRGVRCTQCAGLCWMYSAGCCFRARQRTSLQACSAIQHRADREPARDVSSARCSLLLLDAKRASVLPSPKFGARALLCWSETDLRSRDEMFRAKRDFGATSQVLRRRAPTL